MAVYFDVTLIVDSSDQVLTGIPRVVYEVGKRLVARGAQCVAWDGWRKVFVAVDFETTVERIAAAHAMDPEATLDEAADASGFRIEAPLVSLLSRLGAVVPSDRNGFDWAVRPALWALAASHPRLPPASRRAAAARLGIPASSRRTYQYLDLLLSCRRGVRSLLRRRGTVSFGEGDALMIPAIWWPEEMFDALQRMDPARQMRVVGLIYDLIPIRRPEMFASREGQDKFRRFIHRLLERADRVCAISRFVAADVEAYAREGGLGERSVATIPLCSDMVETVGPTMTARLDCETFTPGRFVPLVSTINPRKNHHWAYELWRRAYDEMGDALPALVFVGHRGWDYADLFTRLERDKELWGRKVVHLDAATDGEIAWLYRNCAYTIFPSQYEGWGLPISESLSFGKYCLAADNTSLREAGAGMAFHADTFDGAAWLTEVRRLAIEPGYLEEMTSKAASHTHTRGWDDVTGEIEALLR